jgi:hypothetical protein
MVATLLRIKPHESERNEDGSPMQTVYLDEETCRVYSDKDGSHYLRSVEPSDEGMILCGLGSSPGAAKARVLRHPSGRPSHVADLVMEATIHYHQKVANLRGTKVQCKVRDENGDIVTLDLSPTDVHQPAVMPYAAGYRISDGIADIMSPVVPVGKQADYYGTWNVSSDFSRKMANLNAVGGQVAEVNPGLSFSQYNALPYALAGALPTEVLANADTPFAPLPKLMQVLTDALRLEREVRVVAQLEASGNWQTSLVQTLLAGAQWDEGAASNPILNIHQAIDASYKPITGIGISGQMWRAFVRNAAVQKFFTYKDMVDGIPTPEALADKLKLPPFYVAEMKYTVNQTLAFAWGAHVVLISQPSSMPPTNQMDVQTALTFRWTGGDVPPDGGLTGGFLVRTYFDQKRGPRGSTVVVCAHNDAEVMTSGYVGGLILNAYQ